MLKKPFFSIIIPTYNRDLDLQFALFCILRQTFRDFEVIVSDNCSTDSTRKIFQSLKDKRIKYFRNKQNIIYSLNVKNAMTHASGEYVFLHSDDDFLLYQNSLEKIYKQIKKRNPGYVRANYMCISSDRKKLFYFKFNKPFVNDQYLQPFSPGKKIVSFIVNSDHYFISGTIFKNTLPKNITFLPSEHAPWMSILLYVTENFGAYFIKEPSIVASWSTWRNKKSGAHPVYSLTNGKLESESYFNSVRRMLDEGEYQEFVHTQLIGIYVRLFLLIKVLVGSSNLLVFAKRIRVLDPLMKKEPVYWIYLIIALIFPGAVIKIVKKTFLSFYIDRSKVDKEKQVVMTLKRLEQDYFKSGGNIIKGRDTLFNLS